MRCSFVWRRVRFTRGGGGDTFIYAYFHSFYISCLSSTIFFLHSDTRRRKSLGHFKFTRKDCTSCRTRSRRRSQLSRSYVSLHLSHPPQSPPLILPTPARFLRKAKWSQALTLLLPKESPTLNVVIDSGGGSALIQAVTRPLVQGGKVVCYGMTSGEDLKIGMGFVLKNCELRCKFYFFSFTQELGD